MSIGILFGRTLSMRPFIVACFLSLVCATTRADNLGIPLNDLGPRPYRLGYIGGLYENGSNQIPADHLADGLRFAEKIEPLDANGQPSPTGKIGFILIGNGDTNRVIESFTSMIAENPHVNPAVTLLDATNEDFTNTNNNINPLLDQVKSQVLDPAGLTEQQVQVAWLQMSYKHPTVDITCPCASDYDLKIDMAFTLRALNARYPNLHVAYLSSRPFAGYSADAWNTEPFAYDTALAMRLIIADQIEEVRANTSWDDIRVGPINYNKGEAPWIAWGPYMWANGTTPRSDGLTWQPEDYDGGLLSAQGAHKAATLLFDFLTSDPTARLWFAATGLPSRARAVRH